MKSEDPIEDELMKPPQVALDDHELENWLQNSSELFGS